MTLQELSKLVRKKILESSNDIIEDSDILLYLNTAKDEIAKRYLANKLIKIGSVSFVNGIADFPADYDGHYKTTDNFNNEYRFVNPDDFMDRTYNNMLVELEGKLQIYPQETKTLSIAYIKKLTDMAYLPSVVNPPVEISSSFHLALVYKAVSLCFEDLQDYDISEYYDKKYEKEYIKQASITSDLEENTQESSTLLKPLPDMNFNGSINNPNSF